MNPLAMESHIGNHRYKGYVYVAAGFEVGQYSGRMGESTHYDAGRTVVYGFQQLLLTHLVQHALPSGIRRQMARSFVKPFVPGRKVFDDLVVSKQQRLLENRVHEI